MLSSWFVDNECCIELRYVLFYTISDMIGVVSSFRPFRGRLPREERCCYNDLAKNYNLDDDQDDETAIIVKSMETVVSGQ